MRELAVFNPVTRRAAREVAGDGIEAEAHHVRHVESARSGGDDVAMPAFARLADQVRCRDADAAACAACCAGGGRASELPPAVAVAKVRLENAALDHAI